MATDRWIETYRCPCGKSTVTTHCSEEEGHAYWCPPVERDDHVNCPECNARYVLLGDRTADRAAHVRRNAAAGAKSRIDVAVWSRKTALAQALAAHIATPMKSMAEEHRLLTATYRATSGYQTYIRERKKTSWPNMLANYLRDDPRVTAQIPPELLAEQAAAKAEAAAAETAWNASLRPYTRTLIPENT